MKHTPGPWKAQNGMHAAIVWGKGEYALDFMVARCSRAKSDIIDETHNANAHLIAAAPELLVACDAAMHALRSYQYGNGSSDLAEATANALEEAISKANGG